MQRKAGDVGRRQPVPLRIGQRDLRTGRQGGIGHVGAQTGQAHHRRQRAVELAGRVLGAHGGDQRRLAGIGRARVGGDHQRRSALQRQEPGTLAALGVGRHVARGAGESAGCVEADQIFVALQPRLDLGEPLGALESDRAGRQRLQQHLRRLDPRPGDSAAALGGGGQLDALHLALTLEREAGLHHAQDQHRQQGDRQRKAEPQSDRGGPDGPHEAGRFHLAWLRRSAWARIELMASPAAEPSRV